LNCKNINRRYTQLNTPSEHRNPVLHLLQGTVVRTNSGEGSIDGSDPSKRTVPTPSSQILPPSTDGQRPLNGDAADWSYSSSCPRLPWQISHVVRQQQRLSSASTFRSSSSVGHKQQTSGGRVHLLRARQTLVHRKWYSDLKIDSNCSSTSVAIHHDHHRILAVDRRPSAHIAFISRAPDNIYPRRADPQIT
ncbi:hypothetical protein ACLOJK_037132, partial [Asimina triloba]